MSDRIHLLVSPEAGRGRADGAHAAVVATLRGEGVEPIDITGADAAGSLAAARQAVDEGIHRILVVGGDGLVQLALQAVATTDTVLGVVPVGTGNDFVRGLEGFATDIEPATRAALGPPTPLDAIRTDDCWVASVATAGFSGDVNERANRLRRPKGPSRYTLATMLELPRLERRELAVIVDGRRHEYRSALVAVGNTGWFGGGMAICPDADPTDGQLDVTVVGDVSRIELLRFFRLVFSGSHMRHPKVTAHRGAEVRLESAGLPLWGDGEPIDVAPATLRAVPGALRLAGFVS
jgi:diacylglycerol kinase (ATP)